MIADLLFSFFDVTLDHNSLDHLLHIIIVSSAVKNFADNTNLFFELLIGVGMVRINDRCRVFQVFLRINIYQTDKILIMVVRNTGSIFVNTTTITEFIITEKSPLVGFFIPTGMSIPLAVRRCCWFSTERAPIAS